MVELERVLVTLPWVIVVAAMYHLLKPVGDGRFITLPASRRICYAVVAMFIAFGLCINVQLFKSVTNVSSFVGGSWVASAGMLYLFCNKMAGK